MNKSLEALRRIDKHLPRHEETQKKEFSEYVSIIEKELKVLEIIKKHIVNRDSDTSGVYLEYHLGLFEPYYSIEIKRGVNQIITEKEYDLLKEVLL